MQSAVIRDLHPLLRINWAESGNEVGPADPSELVELLAAYPHTPPDYLDIVRQYDFLSIGTQPGHEPYFSLSLLPPSDVLAWSDWYSWLPETMPGAFFFGRDGDMGLLTGEYDGMVGVFKVEISAGTWPDASYLAPSIRALLCEGTGWANGGEPL